MPELWPPKSSQVVDIFRADLMIVFGSENERG